jgi:hypothetical protein
MENIRINLDTPAWSQDTMMDTDRMSRLEQSLYRRICALVDLPSTHAAVMVTAEECLIGLFQQLTPSHLPLAKDKFRLMHFEPAGDAGEINVTLTNRSLDEVGDDYSAVYYCWGSSTQPLELIIVNGRLMIIYESLFTLESLSNLRFRLIPSRRHLHQTKQHRRKERIDSAHDAHLFNSWHG